MLTSDTISSLSYLVHSRLRPAVDVRLVRQDEQPNSPRFLSASSDHHNDRIVLLKGGLVLPVEPIQLALELEERGFTLTRMDGDTLLVQPYERLTRDDCQRIKRWKW